MLILHPRKALNEYQGIKKEEYPDSPIWSYIALYSSITDDFDTDKPLQRLVKLHYLKIKLLKTAFNLSIYLIFYIITQTIGR